MIGSSLVSSLSLELRPLGNKHRNQRQLRSSQTESRARKNEDAQRKTTHHDLPSSSSARPSILNPLSLLQQPHELIIRHLSSQLTSLCHPQQDGLDLTRELRSSEVDSRD